MNFKIKMPRLAETTDLVVIVAWEVAVGDEVTEGQTLVTAETDKAILAVPSPVAGRVVNILVQADQEVSAGTPIVEIEGE